MKKTIFYYKINSTFRYITDIDDEIKESEFLEYTKCKNYRLNEKYNACDEDLIKFKKDLINNNNEIKKNFFLNKDKKAFNIDVFRYNTLNEAIYNNVIINSNQKIINEMPDIKFMEFIMMQNLKTSGLMTLKHDIIGKINDNCFGYDYKKFYYEIMKRIRIPITSPVYYEIDEIDFNKLDFGIYRVKIICDNPLFLNIFNFNPKHHYTHNTLKVCYKFKDKYGIKFKLLKPDDNFKYNFVHYDKTIELKNLFKGYFKIMDELLLKCKSNNFLIKNYVSTIWGVLSKYNKIYVKDDDAEKYDFEHINKINCNERYDYYLYEHSDNIMTLINSKKAYKNGGLARIKSFLPEYCRNFIFEMISSNNLENDIIRIQTDGIVFNKEIDFKNMKMKYYPVKEDKTSGRIKFYNVNSYFHVDDDNNEYKYKK
jgi:hypothetical protein